MPNWLKHTLHTVATIAVVVAGLPLTGIGLPLWVAPLCTGIAALATKFTPGAGQGQAK